MLNIRIIRRRLPWLLALVIVSAAAPALGDRGSILFEVGARLYEPSQDALIAWNGHQELLLLQTKLRASKPTKVLELIPLPAQPQVSKGDAGAFRRATAIINARSRQRRAKGPGDLLDDPFARGRAPAAVVTARKQIGAHDISTVKVLRSADFVGWVHRFLAQRKVAASQLPNALTAIIDRYVTDGYRWFVFDVVAVSKRARKVAPIAYRFASPKLYYPLRISRLDTGRTRVRLLLLTRRGVQFARTKSTPRPGVGRFRCRREVWPFRLRQRQLERIDHEAASLLGSAGARLSQWRCSGPLAAADFDLLGTDRKPTRRRSRRSRSKGRNPDLMAPF